MTDAIRLGVDADGIATITIDVPDKSMNVLTNDSMRQLEAHIRTVAEDDAVKGAVITSGKDNAFVAGADISMLAALANKTRGGDLDAAFEEAFTGNRVFRAMETCGKPIAAAVNGLALGGGFEVVLACHYRVVADDPKIRLGLPEVTLGLLPGAGGTQRLPRLIGIQAAAPLLLKGKQISPQEAEKLGIVQKIMPADQIEAEARRWILEDGNAVQPWDEKGFKIPGGGGQFNRDVVQAFMGGTTMMAKETWHNYSAPLAILSCVYEGHQLPMDRAIKVESRYFTQLLTDPSAGNMMRTLFLNKNEADKLKRRPAGIEPAPVQKLGVLGAGLMGAGIAHVSARAGMAVVLLDREQALAEKGKAHAEREIQKRIERGRMAEDDGAAILKRIHPTTDYNDLAGCDLIVEAVVEDADIKADATQKTEAVIPDTAIFGTNTSTFPITHLAGASERPDRVIGIHFFSPVERMPLVEIIKGKETGDAALAKALDYVRQLRKTPIVVNDSRAFYASRTVGTYVNEALEMLHEGVNPALMENCGRLAGMPMGPLALADSVGIDLLCHVYDSIRGDLPGSFGREIPGEIVTLMAKKLERPGRKAGQGFYDYGEKGDMRLWPELTDHFPSAEDQPDAETVQKRLLYIQVIEAVRCFQEEVVTTPEEADIGALLGWGFAPFTGGPLSFIDTQGAAVVLEECAALEKAFGPRFAPPDLLLRKAEEGSTFYPPLFEDAA